jgi:hypothetical protein
MTNLQITAAAGLVGLAAFLFALFVLLPMGRGAGRRQARTPAGRKTSKGSDDASSVLLMGGAGDGRSPSGPDRSTDRPHGKREHDPDNSSDDGGDGGGDSGGGGDGGGGGGD